MADNYKTEKEWSKANKNEQSWLTFNASQKMDKGVLANIEDSAEKDIQTGTIWTNLTKEEIKICFPSGHQTIPHSGYNRCILTKSENQSISKESYTDITFDQETEDQGDMHFIKVNNDRIIVKENHVYFISYMLEIKAMANINYLSRIRINDTDIILRKSKDAPGTVSNSIFLGRSGIYKATADGFITLQAAQHHSANLDVIKTNTTLMIQRWF